MSIPCFNPSTEGQPLQREIKGYRPEANLFQSLCRGTAIATTAEELSIALSDPFQSLCRGTAIATILEGRNEGCNSYCFNPSVEGQPLQQESS